MTLTKYWVYSGKDFNYLFLQPNNNFGKEWKQVYLAADVEAVEAQHEAREKQLKAVIGLDCGDHSCKYAVETKGQRTSGGCRCDKAQPIPQRLLKAEHALAALLAWRKEQG